MSFEQAGQDSIKVRNWRGGRFDKILRYILAEEFDDAPILNADQERVKHLTE